MCAKRKECRWRNKKEKYTWATSMQCGCSCSCSRLVCLFIVRACALLLRCKNELWIYTRIMWKRAGGIYDEQAIKKERFRRPRSRFQQSTALGANFCQRQRQRRPAPHGHSRPAVPGCRQQCSGQPDPSSHPSRVSRPQR